ncbi:MAG: LamG-like jellyroll fold domain-containing protein [Erythrobacter sp.]
MRRPLSAARRPALVLVVIAALMALVALPAARAQPAGYQPIVAAFNGNGAIAMPANEALDINGLGTIEFWVSAKWQGELDYDPAVMGYSGPQGPRFAIHIAGDKSGLGLFAGPFYDGVAFDFSDGVLHHVALVTLGDMTDIIIDGVYLDTLGFTFAELPAESFTIGAIGEFSPFIGEIGQVRIWSTPVEIEVLRYFSLAPLSAEGPFPHPDLEFLTGISAFGDPETGGFIFIGDPDMQNMTQDPPAIEGGNG